jgi:DNA-binding NtrC family response regulator
MPAADRSVSVSRVLVLEDELGFQTLLTEVLGGAGHEVVSAQSGAVALDLAAERPFDLLLVDNRMPGISGLEFLKRFRAIDPHAPVIIMTAYADVPVVVEAMRLGVVDFLVKPFSLDSLLPLVERSLQAAARPNPSP